MFSILHRSKVFTMLSLLFDGVFEKPGHLFRGWAFLIAATCLRQARKCAIGYFPTLYSGWKLSLVGYIVCDFGISVGYGGVWSCFGGLWHRFSY